MRLGASMLVYRVWASSSMSDLSMAWEEVGMIMLKSTSFPFNVAREPTKPLISSMNSSLLFIWTDLLLRPDAVVVVLAVVVVVAAVVVVVVVVVEQSTKVPATHELVTVVVTVAVARLVLVLVIVNEINRALASPSVGSIRPASMASPMSRTMLLVSWSTMGPVRARPSKQRNGRNPLMVKAEWWSGLVTCQKGESPDNSH